MKQPCVHELKNKMKYLLTFLFLSGIILPCDMVIGMSNTENNSGPGGLCIPLLTSRPNQSPIATGAASHHKKLKGGIIYKATNLINGKIYIGKTIYSLSERKSKHLYYAKKNNNSYVLHAAINKYGADNFQWEIVDQCLFPDMLCELEKKYIKQFNCKTPHGYNLTDGGEGMAGYVSSEATRQKVRVANIGRKLSQETKDKIRATKMVSSYNWGRGRTFTEEHKKHIRENARTNPNFGMKGKHPSEETKEKIRLTKLGSAKKNWIAEYQCGCSSKSNHKKKLLKYCRVHGDGRIKIYISHLEKRGENVG
jgi:group I intron endonuclease